MKMTHTLKQWLVEKKGLQADASDDVARAAAGAALMDDSLPHDEFVKMTADPDGQKADSLESKIDKMLGMVEAQQAEINTLKQKPVFAADAPRMPGDLFAKAGSMDRVREPSANVDVKSVEKMYDCTTKSATFPMFNELGKPHPLGGRKMWNGTEGKPLSHPINEPSELDHAINGAVFKLMLTNGGTKGVPVANMRMTDHDWDLVKYAMHERRWGGTIGGEFAGDRGVIEVENRKLTDFEMKAMLDDTTSGGQYITPITFDDNVITTPLLNGEFYPLIDDVPITRGRRIVGGSMGNVTLTWGGGDGSNITLFNTASFVSAFDTNIFVVDGAFLIGLDHLSDSPVNVGKLVTDSYGRAYLRELDRVIQVGNGNTQPTGVISSGGTSVTPSAGAGGAAVLGDFESLIYAVKKQYKTGAAANRIAFGMTETSYQRARSIAVGATDARRAMWFAEGLTPSSENYSIFQRACKLSDTMTNAQVTFGNYQLGYRMYRRLGATIKQTTEGYTLVRANELMITMRARFGGRPTLSGYWALSTNWQA